MLSWDEFNIEENASSASAANNSAADNFAKSESKKESIKQSAQDFAAPASGMAGSPVAAEEDSSQDSARDNGQEEQPTAEQLHAIELAKAAVEKLDIEAAEKELSASAERVKVDDKRMINCRADLNQLVPFKYDWTWMAVPITGCHRKSI